MPYKYVIERWHLPKEYNRRRKLSDADREQIRKAYKNGCSINGLARTFGVSKRLIQFMLFPEREEHCKKLRALRGGSAHYYDRERNNRFQRDTRNYKQKIYLKLKGKTNE